MIKEWAWLGLDHTHFLSIRTGVYMDDTTKEIMSKERVHRSRITVLQSSGKVSHMTTPDPSHSIGVCPAPHPSSLSATSSACCSL